MHTKAEAPVTEPLHISGVTRRYRHVTALHHVDLRVHQDEVVAVVGPSGCGKSTLLELIAGLQQPDEGTVTAAEASYMPQRDLLLPWRDALSNAALALECEGVPRREARRRAEILLLDEPFGALDSITRASMQRWLADALSREPRTVVLVTHDVDEAVFLADRVVVLSPRPGHVVADIEVDIDGPRDVTSPEFGAVKRRALEALGI